VIHRHEGKKSLRDQKNLSNSKTLMKEFIILKVLLSILGIDYIYNVLPCDTRLNVELMC